MYICNIQGSQRPPAPLSVPAWNFGSGGAGVEASGNHLIENGSGGGARSGLTKRKVKLAADDADDADENGVSADTGPAKGAARAPAKYGVAGSNVDDDAASEANQEYQRPLCLPKMFPQRPLPGMAANDGDDGDLGDLKGGGRRTAADLLADRDNLSSRGSEPNGNPARPMDGLMAAVVKKRKAAAARSRLPLDGTGRVGVEPAAGLPQRN